MKTCPACGIDTDDRFLFCPDDGSALESHAKNGGDHLFADMKSSLVPKLSMLFCPACENEYPLTFSTCPIDGLRLTRERRGLTRPGASQVEVAAPDISSRPEDETLVGVVAEDATSHYDSIDESFSDEEADYFDREASMLPETGLIERIRTDRPSFRIAAVATIIGLALFGLSAIYRLYTYGLKKPSLSAPEATMVAQKEAPPSFFIETPKEAREYLEQDAPPAESKTQPIEENTEKVRPVEQKGPARKKPEQPPEVSAGRLKGVSAPVTPHSTAGRVESRLVRIRGSRTQPGYRYDLTFTMQETGGSPIRWDSLTVSARSASGVNHLQTLPFRHRLGASGKLSFTVSIDMTGRSERDWRGRIVCTSVGMDNSGRLLRATFGANVSP